MTTFRALKQIFLQEGSRVFVIMSAGDVIAQTLVEKKAVADVDFIRTLKFGSVGMFFVGPCLRVWYSSLDRWVSPNQKPLMRAFKKMAMDQLLLAPVLSASLVGIFGKVNGDSTEKIKQRLRDDYPQIMLRNYMLWPAAQMINFSVVPVSYQVIFAQFVAIIWNTYMSLILNKQ